MRFSILAVVPLLAINAVACGQEEADEASGEPATERVCINIRAIRTFDAFTDQHVYVRAGSDHYLMTMRNRCHDLRDAMGIAIKDATSRVCSDGFGEIIYRNRMGGQRFESCRIQTIEKVESKDEARAIAEGHSDRNRGMDKAAEENKIDP